MSFSVVDSLVEYAKDDTGNIEGYDGFPDESSVMFSYCVNRDAGLFTEEEMPYEIFRKIMYVKVDEGKYLYRFPGEVYYYIKELLKKNSVNFQSNQEEF